MNVNKSGGRPSTAHKKSGKDWANHRWSERFEIVSRLDYCSVDMIKEILDDIPAVHHYIGAVHDGDSSASGAEKLPHFHGVVFLHSGKQLRNSTLLNAARKAALERSEAYRDAVADNENVPAVLTAALRGRPCAAITYLRHLTDDAAGKAQYDYSALFGSPGLDLVAEFDAAYDEYQKNRESGASLAASSDGGRSRAEIVAELEPLIKEGKIAPYQFTAHLTSSEYVKHRGHLMKLCDYYDNDNRLNGRRRVPRVMMVSGIPGSGKTSSAMWMSEDRGYGIPYISSGGSDLLSMYQGEHFVILDDVRPASSSASDFIKMIQPHARGAVHSRFRDKDLDADYIVITSPLTPEEWWSSYLSYDKDAGDVKQLLRRLNGGAMHFDKFGVFSYRQFDGDGYEIARRENVVLPQQYFDWLMNESKRALPPPSLLSFYYDDSEITSRKQTGLQFTDAYLDATFANHMIDAMEGFAEMYPDIVERLASDACPMSSDIVSILRGVIPTHSSPEAMPFPEASDGPSDAVSDSVGVRVSLPDSASLSAF